jgi:hypothetical protein
MITWRWPFFIQPTTVTLNQSPPSKQKVRTVHHRHPPKGEKAQATRRMIEDEREFRTRSPGAFTIQEEIVPFNAGQEEKEEVPAKVQEMSDDSSKPTKEPSPMSQQVKESMQAGLTAKEGAEYISMPMGHYKIVAALIALERHTNGVVKTQSSNFLTRMDQNGVQKNFRAAVQFLKEHRSFFNKQEDRPTQQQLAAPEWKSLTTMERRRLKAITQRSDVSNEDSSKAKALVAAIIDGQLTTQDHDRMVVLIRGHYANGVRKDWKKVKKDIGRPDISLRLKSLIARIDVNDADKERAAELLSSIVDDHIKSVDYAAAQQLWFANKASKKELGRRVTVFDTFINAVFMACQACENLSDQEVPIHLPLEERLKLVTKLNASAQDLLRLQRKLIEEKKDD